MHLIPKLLLTSLLLSILPLPFETLSQNSAYSLSDFYRSNSSLDRQVDSIFLALNDSQRVAQMIVTSAGELGKKDEIVYRLANHNQIGGLVFLKGTKEKHKKMIDSLNQIAKKNKQLPLLFSIDAEPSLFNGRLLNTAPMMNTIDIKTKAQSDSIAELITKQLLNLGFHQNYAPVCDISPGNDAIKDRSFGENKKKVIELSKQFIKTTQSNGMIATAKHFPGHGLVSGDTHKKSVYIDGMLKELDVYPPLIKSGVISIMVAHITIINNKKYGTEGLPASCSKTIVTDLLKNKLGFKGLIITDALNIMKAVTIIENAPLKASKAGCDILLMPTDEQETIDSILEEMKVDAAYQEQVYNSVKKIIRLKLLTVLIESN